TTSRRRMIYASCIGLRNLSRSILSRRARRAPRAARRAPRGPVRAPTHKEPHMTKMLGSIRITVLMLLPLAARAQTMPSDLTLKNVTIQGSLDLENGVPVRWKKPDGSGYVNIFELDKNGTLRLGDDPYYY